MEIISAKHVVPIDSDPIMAGAIAVENGEIIDVGREADLLARYPHAPREDHPNQVLMPGLVNAHTHLDMSAHKNYPFDPVRSMVVNTGFVDWLLATIEYKRRANPEMQRAAVQEGAASCIESGTTCVGDMGTFDGIFQTLEIEGLRAVVFPEVLSYDSAIAKDLFQTAMAIVEKYIDYDSDLVSVGMGPYSPYTLSRQLLRLMSFDSKSSNLPLMIHVAESFSEMEFFYNSSGDIATHLFPNIGWGETLPPEFRKTPVAYLDDIDFLSSQSILVGCVNVTPDDLKKIAQKKSKIVWCPRSNQYLRQSVAPVGDMIQSGIVVALGTDGLSSTNTLSLWDEMRVAMDASAENNFNLSAKDILNMATLNAAIVLGRDDEIGSLTPGKRADYIVVDASSWQEGSPFFDTLIRETKTYHIKKVVINGRIVKNMN